MSHHSRVRQSGGSRVQTITFAAQIKPSHLVVEHSDMCCISTELFSQNSFSQTSQNGSAYMHGSNSNYTGLKTELPPGTRLEGVHFLLCYRQFFHFFSHTFTLVWLFWLWNQVGCVFTVAPTFTSSSHWSQIWSRTSAGRANCASIIFLLATWHYICSTTQKQLHSEMGGVFTVSLKKKLNKTQMHLLGVCTLNGVKSDLERDPI